MLGYCQIKPTRGGPFLSLAHEDTLEEIFFPASGMHQIAASGMCSCTVRT